MSFLKKKIMQSYPKQFWKIMSPFKNSLRDLLILMDVTLYIPQEINI